VPRFAPLFELGESSKFPQQHGNINILYIPGAFASHGLNTHHHLQQRQIREIVEYISQDESGRYLFIVKMHPREREEDYTWMRKYDSFVRIVPSSTNLYETILSSHVVVTILSTVAYEAVLLKKPVIVARFPEPNLLSQKYIVDDFQVVDSVQKLMESILKIIDNRELYTDLVENECQSVYKVIDRKTPESASLIAQQICVDV